MSRHVCPNCRDLSTSELRQLCRDLGLEGRGRGRAPMCRRFRPFRPQFDAYGAQVTPTSDNGAKQQALQEIGVDKITYFTFMPHQQRLVERMAQICRRQHGVVLIHSMGSGKTISSLGTWLNFPRPKRLAGSNKVMYRLVIITPPGLDSAFREDLEAMGFSKRDQKRMLDNGEMVFLDYDDIANGLKQTDGSRLSMPETLRYVREMLEDAFIIADEAHNFVTILKEWAVQRKSEQYTALLDAFNDAYKVILLSGTPLQQDWSDLTILASLAAGYDQTDPQLKLPVYPTYTSQINIRYPVDFRWSLWARQKFLEDSTILGTLGGLAGVAMSLLYWPPAMTAYGLAMGAWGLHTLFGSAKYRAETATGVLSSTVGGFAGPVPQFSVEKMADDLAKHVSYFNYQDLDYHLTKKFPLNEVVVMPVYYSSFQADMYLKQARLADVLDKMELEFTGRTGQRADAFQLGESVNIQTNDMDHYSRMRVIGNLSEDNYFFTTVRQAQADSLGNRMYYVWPRYKDKWRRKFDLSAGFSSDGVVRPSPTNRAPSPWTDADRYDAMLRNYQSTYLAHKLRQYKTRIDSHRKKLQVRDDAGEELQQVQADINDITQRLEDGEALTDDIQAQLEQLEDREQELEDEYPLDVSLFRLQNMETVIRKRDNNLTFAVNKFLTSIRVLGDERAKYHYLPIFYSNFDEYGFQLFSALLTQRGYYHYVIHPSDEPIARQRLISLANLPYRRFKRGDGPLDYVPMDYDEEDVQVVRRLNLNRWENTPEDERVPFCVLLHPSIVEGLSFSLSPSMVVNESVDGYGRAEQLYARILRAIGNDAPYDFRLLRNKATSKARLQELAEMTEEQLFADLEPNGGGKGKRADRMARDKRDFEAIDLRQVLARANSMGTSRFINTLAKRIEQLPDISAYHRHLIAETLVRNVQRFAEKPPKTVAECVTQGFSEETDIPPDYPRMIVKENIMYRKADPETLRKDTLGRYEIKLLDKTTGYVYPEDYCDDVRVGSMCRSPVYFELSDDYKLQRCRKTIYLLQNTFGKWTLLSGKMLQSWGEYGGLLEPLKTAVDITIPKYWPPILDFSAVLTGKQEEAVRPIIESPEDQGFFGRFRSPRAIGYQDAVRYFTDSTYPGGLWNIASPEMTNDINSTATPDEIIETNNRVIMFNWLQLTKILREKFLEEAEAFCDELCIGKCEPGDKPRPDCQPWLQEDLKKGTNNPALVSQQGTCHKREMSTTRGSEESRRLYDSLESSAKATDQWEKHYNALRANPGTQDELRRLYREALQIPEDAELEDVAWTKRMADTAANLFRGITFFQDTDNAQNSGVVIT